METDMKILQEDINKHNNCSNIWAMLVKKKKNKVPHMYL